DGTFEKEVPTQVSPYGIAAVPGNALAFAAWTASGYGLVGVDGGEAEIPAALAALNLVFAPDGRIWATHVGSSSVTAYHYLSHSAPTSSVSVSYAAFGITVGPDGRIWVTAGDQQHSELAACPIEGGACTEYHLPTAVYPEYITLGADG